jgi:putative AlgH/UPF0301 family transcriptional regulator
MAWVSFFALTFAVGLCAFTNSYSVRNCNRLDLRSFSSRRARPSLMLLMCSPVDIVPDKVSPAAILKKGVVLLAQPSEENDFLSKAAILIYDYGTERGTTGVILERETAFSMGETTPNSGPFEPNTLYLGGEGGSDTAMMFHKYDLSGFSKYIGAGMYLGGIKEAKELVVSRKAHPRDFKFIFNSVEWETGVLEREILAGRWDMANVPPNLILQQSRAREVDSIWLNVRKTLGLRLQD